MANDKSKGKAAVGKMKSGSDHPPQAAYEAYYTTLNPNNTLPPWDSLSSEQQAAWCAAANAAIAANS